MDAVNCAGSRPADARAGTSKVESRRSIFLRFMNAMKESRRCEARRVITTYAHLLAEDDAAKGRQRGR